MSQPATIPVPQPESQPQHRQTGDLWDDTEAAGTPIDLVAFLRTYFLRWPFLLLMSLAGAALTYGLTFLLAPRYTSRAVFLPPSQQVSSSDSALSLLFKTPSTAIYTGLLLSDSVVTEVVERSNLQAIFKSRDIEDARDQLRRITQTSTDNAGFVSLQVTYTDPALARDIAQNFLLALSHLNDRLAVSEASQHRLIFQAQLEKAKNDLETAEVALKRAQESSGVVSPDTQIKSGLSAIDVARAEIRAKNVALAALLKSETDQAPEVQRLRSEIGAESGQLAGLEGAASTGRGSGLSAGEAPSVALRFVQLEREVKYNQVLFDVMAKQFENARLQESSAAPGVQVVDLPQVPLHKSWPTRKLFLVAGFALGLFLALLLVFFAERRRRYRSTEPDALGSLRQAIAHPVVRP